MAIFNVLEALPEYLRKRRLSTNITELGTSRNSTNDDEQPAETSRSKNMPPLSDKDKAAIV